MKAFIKICLNLIIICIALYVTVGTFILSFVDINTISIAYLISYGITLGLIIGTGVITIIKVAITNIINISKPINLTNLPSIVYENEIKVMMNGYQIDYTSTVYTYVVKKRCLWFWTTYTIVQNNPRIKSPTYDIEYASNKRLRSLRNSEYAKAKMVVIACKANKY